MIAYQISKENLLAALLECEAHELDAFLHDCIMQNVAAKDVVSAARKMGLEPLSLTSLLEAANKLKEEEK
jgi:hypothetical protein